MAAPAPASPAHNLASLLVDSARRFPALPAVAVGSAVRHDYAALAARVTRLAGAFSAAGLTARDRVALVARNCADYLETLFACWHAGLCAVPVNSKLHPSELAYVLENSGARWAFVDAAWDTALAWAGPMLVKARSSSLWNANLAFDGCNRANAIDYAAFEASSSAVLA